MMRKVARDRAELINELKEQIDLLAEALDNLNLGDFKYGKVVATVLRILVIESPKNKPLLFTIADSHSFIPMVVTDSPFGIKNLPLKDHLRSVYFLSGTEKISMSNERFIKIATQQDGGAHVDQEIDFDYMLSNKGILLGGLPPKIYKLKILGSHVLKAGRELLININENN